jgi:hypothetical protein
LNFLQNPVLCDENCHKGFKGRNFDKVIFHDQTERSKLNKTKAEEGDTDATAKKRSRSISPRPASDTTPGKRSTATRATSSTKTKIAPKEMNALVQPARTVQLAVNQQLRRNAALIVKHQETMQREMAAQLAKVSKSIVLYCVVLSCTRPL